MKSVMKEPLINLINEQIYWETDTWQNGAIASGEDLGIRSVKVRGLLEEDIGTSVSNRIIYNDLKRFTAFINREYQKNVCDFYASTDSVFQFLLYDAKMKGHYDYHTDHMKENPRILTMLVGLNSVDDYDGGELLVQNNEKGVKLDKGDVVVFPSNFMYPHKVSPVTRGERRVLIIWTQ
jgi:predicted 2-oxoglutarate/Fe(II)-dependent dioxygenase YbiX|tara:strand:+ start:2076 stop:2612 length:537 start_codon:yes stop_codon:yes gene_type:complete